MNNHYGKPPATETADGKYIHGYPKVFPPPDYSPATETGTQPPDGAVGDLLASGDIIVQEKLDGGQYRVRLDQGNPVFASKKNILGTDPDTFNGFFQRPAKHLCTALDAAGKSAAIEQYGPLTLFGENMLRHALDYAWSRVPPFLVFDIYVHQQGSFLPVDQAQTLTDQLGLSFVPILDRIPASRFDSEAYAENLPESQYRDGPAEGVVLKNYQTEQFAKLVNDQFKEVHHDRWGYTQTHAEDYTDLVAARYVTNERIEQQLRKLVIERGPGSLSMELVRPLKERVYDDIWDEHYHEIAHPKNRTDLDGSGQQLDLRQLQKLTMQRCKTRLKTILDNQKLVAEEVDGGLQDAEYLDLMLIGESATHP